MHVGIPVSPWNPEPSPTFHDAAKRFALAHAERAGIAIDPSVYSKTRLFRAPNSRHATTGLFKRRLSLDELTHLTPEAIIRLAECPEPFAIPNPIATCPAAVADWRDAVGAADRRAVERRAAYPVGTPKLNALTRAFIRDGADEGERAARLFQAAANLAEFDRLSDLAHALLTEPALDTGLTPSETKHQIDSGLAHARRQQEGRPA